MSEMVFENDEICISGVTLKVDYDYQRGTPRTWNYPGDPEEVTVNAVTMELGGEVRDITSFLTPDLERSFKDDILEKIHAFKEDAA